MNNKNVNEYFIGSIFADGVLLKTTIFKLKNQQLIDVKDEKTYFNLGQKKLDYSVINGVIKYTELELKDIVSLDFLKTLYKNNNSEKITDEYKKTMKLKKELALENGY